MADAKMTLQLKIGQCVSAVLEDVNKRTPDEVEAFVASGVLNAKQCIRDARRASEFTPTP